MADGTRRDATDEDRADVQNDCADARGESGTDRDSGGELSASSPVTRRWRALDRGWQALALGLVIVAGRAVVF